jgi:predicted acylesterase/phospholipase RssA
VATNVGAGSEAVISTGSVGWGARCSSSFPGIFTPTTGDGFRFVDGGIVRNVPTDPLVWHDCDLLIASNIVPNPKFQVERSPRFPGAAGRWLHEFNLTRRANDTLRSALILMHTASDAVSWDADVRYNSPPSRFLPGDMAEGADIIAEATPSVAALSQQITNAWTLLRGT